MVHMRLIIPALTGGMSLIHYVKFNLLKVENDKNMKLLLIEF